MTATTVAPFEAAIKAFAANYRQSDEVCPAGAVQSRNYGLSDLCAYEAILLAAAKFRASDLFWIDPITVTPDGHAYCRFMLAYFPAEEPSHV